MSHGGSIPLSSAKTKEPRLLPWLRVLPERDIVEDRLSGVIQS